MANYYAGVGSRKTPPKVQTLFKKLATELESDGYILRSGGASGADISFSKGCNIKEIYLPGKEFNGHKADNQTFFDCTKLPNWNEAIAIAKQFHPAPQNLKPFALSLMARNSYQVLGIDLSTPASFIVCWTPQGKPTGGTSQAIRIANSYKIPIINYGLMFN